MISVDALLAPDLEPGTSVVASADELPTGFGYRSFHTLPLGQVIELGRDLGRRFPMRS